MDFTDETDLLALDKIQRERQKRPPNNWSIPDQYKAKAFEIAETARTSPAEAVKDATIFIDGVRKRNLARQVKLKKARKLRSDLIELDKERSPRKDRKAEKEEKEARKQSPASKKMPFWQRWLSSFLNGSSASVPMEIEQDVDEEVLEAARAAGEKTDRGLFTRIPDVPTTATKDGAQQSNASANGDLQVRRGCIPGLFLRNSKPALEEKSADDDHGLQLPITNAGSRGWRGVVQRWLLTTMNATPTSGLNWMEVTKDGLQIYQPLATVSQRTVKHKDVRDRQVVLSIDPPAYFDSFLGILRQFRRNVETPWGEIVIYEGGSGRVIARAIALAPGQKLKQIRTALELLHLAENESEGFLPLPHLYDLFIYVDDQILPNSSSTTEETT